MVIEEDELNGHVLLQAIENLLDNEEMRREMGANALHMVNTKGTDAIAEGIIGLVRS